MTDDAHRRALAAERARRFRAAHRAPAVDNGASVTASVTDGVTERDAEALRRDENVTRYGTEMSENDLEKSAGGGDDDRRESVVAASRPVTHNALRDADDAVTHNAALLDAVGALLAPIVVRLGSLEVAAARHAQALDYVSGAIRAALELGRLGLLTAPDVEPVPGTNGAARVVDVDVDERLADG